MKNLTFLLYILSKCISVVRPALIEALQDWPATTPDINPLHIDPIQFCKSIKLNKDQTEKFLAQFKSQVEVEKQKEEFFKTLEEHNIQTINLFALSYPSQLLQIPDPPLVLYCRGDIKLLESTSLAIVGSRRASGYGKLVVDKLVSSLSKGQLADNNNLTIISGLAYGIDSLSHQAALKNNLKTIAVLGSGIDNEHIYPRANFNLAQEILNAGSLLVTEYPPFTPAVGYQFVARNRIIAGLAQATLVVEAASRSGALLTADFAMDFNRAVFAVPGQIFSPQSQGTNKLISQGAQILNSEQDLFLEFDLHNTTPLENPAHGKSFSTNQLAVLKCMQSGDKAELEELVEKSNLPLTEVLSVLTQLELAKTIIQVNPNIYQKL